MPDLMGGPEESPLAASVLALSATDEPSINGKAKTENSKIVIVLRVYLINLLIGTAEPTGQ